MKIGDTVAIRGDKRLRNDGKTCCYLPDQLVNGKYLKSMFNGRVWTGRVQKIQGDMIKVNGGWWYHELVEVYHEQKYKEG